MLNFSQQLLRMGFLLKKKKKKAQEMTSIWLGLWVSYLVPVSEVAAEWIEDSNT